MTDIATDSAATVGIDIGTSSVKAVVVDRDGTVLARTRVPHRATSPEPGAFQHDVDVAWRANVVEALAHVVQDPEVVARQVVAVEVSAMVPSLAAVGSDGAGLSPGLLYGDHRGHGDAIDASAPGDRGETLAFLEWLTSHAPDATGYWPAQAVANHMLTGVAAIDPAAALSTIPLFGADGWDAQLAEAAGTSTDHLPVVSGAAESIGRVRDGLPAAGALVSGGTIDALGEQLVAGVDDAGDVLAILGTTEIVWKVTDGWGEADGLWTVPHTTAGRVLVGGPSNAGGLFLDRVADWLGRTRDDELDSVGPDDLPVWLPYVRGERCPLHRRDLTVALDGAAVHHGRAHLRLAAFEASAFVARHLLERSAGMGPDPTRIVATGGGVRSRHWVQALADVTGIDVHVVDVPEGAALGAAFGARCAAGIEDDAAAARRWARTAAVVSPRPAWSEAGEARYARFLDLTQRALDA